MSDEEILIDPRTRRPVKQTQRYAETKPKDNAKDLRRRMLFNELIKSPIYPELINLAYQSCSTFETPTSVDQLIHWQFRAIKRAALDSFFAELQKQGKDVPPEEQPVIDKMRQSLFGAVNTELPDKD